MSTLYLCGAGNPEGVRLALNVNAHTKRWGRIVVLDDDRGKHGQSLLEVPILGGFGLLAQADSADQAVNLVARTTKGRAKAGDVIAGHGVPLTSLIDPTIDTLGVEIEEGVTAYRHATLSAKARLARGVVVFAGANAGHGAQIGRGAVLAPGAVVNARVRVGEGAYIGANASVLPDLEIGAWATVGACSSVIQSVPEGATAVGVPAEILTERTATARAACADAPEIEARIAAAWCAVLEVGSIDPNTSFFDLGATSTLALRALERMRADYGFELSPLDVYRFPTARTLAAHLGATHDGSESAGEERARLRRQARRNIAFAR